MRRIYFIRHVESCWNQANRFTGGQDVGLSQKGIDSLSQIAPSLEIPGAVYTSSLMRAKMTASLLLSYKGLASIFDPRTLFANTIPIFTKKDLDERGYGSLEGKEKNEVREQFGKERVESWRRSFKDPPPQGESLFDVQKRAWSCFQQEILPEAGPVTWIVAHGNSLRAILIQIEQMKEEEILHFEIGVGQALIYEEKEENRWSRLKLT